MSSYIKYDSKRLEGETKLSGGLDATDICMNLRKESDGDFWLNIFGQYDHVENSENDLFALASKLKASGKELPKVYMWCWTEDFLYHQNVKLRDHLQEQGFELTYEESPGDHQWKYWDEKIQTVLNWISELRKK